MGDTKGFLKYERAKKTYLPAEERIKGFDEFVIPWQKQEYTEQAARCMDCGIPFCHQGCPLGNKIPDFNDAVYKDNWKDAYHILKSTNNFPEFTGRICPAPCEASCVLGLNNNAVNIEHIEREIAETAFQEGWEIPYTETHSTGKKVAVIGSGPAGLAVADELIKKGHDVVVYERDLHPGGLLRYGIPDFKLDKNIVKRRIDLMQASGVEFKTGIEVGKDVSSQELVAEYDAIVLCTGATIPRDMPVEGRELEGVHFAMDFLTHQNKQLNGEIDHLSEAYNARNKNIVVIGGGDTGADCVGTSNRQGAKNITQIELLDKPPLARAPENPWPEWPMVLTSSTSHEEGANREWSVLTEKFIGEEGAVTGLQTVEIEWIDKSKFSYKKREGSERIIPCDMALLAIGFQHTDPTGIIDDMKLKLDPRGNLLTENFKTSHAKIFAAGDSRRGQSLVVWAIAEGRKAAKMVDEQLHKEDLTT